MQVSSKKAWYKLQKLGLFNITHAFTPDEFLKVHRRFPDDKMFCFRTTGGGGGAFTCMPKARAVREIRAGKWTQALVAEQAPDQYIEVQGEYNGEWARVTFEKTPMRFALQKSSHEITRGQLMGLIGMERFHMLEEILEAFNPTTHVWKNPTIEFSVYSQSLGIQRKDMVIWEIRNY